jgi:hypothetical protein
MVYTPTPAYSSLLKKAKSPSINKKEIKILANEARRIKESILLSYLEKMGSYETNLPCDEEQLQIEHFDLSSSAIKEFDQLMGFFSNDEYSTSEKEDLVRRLNAHYTELKEKNQKYSEKLCSKVFEAVFKDVKGIVLNCEAGHFNIEEIESKWHNAVIQYKAQALGSYAETVFMEEFPCFIPYMASLFREIEFQFIKLKDELEQSIKGAYKHRDLARAGEIRLREMLEETNKMFEQQLENREEIIRDIKASLSSRIAQQESKARDLSRELHVCKLELSQAIREKELAYENNKEVTTRFQEDYEAKISSLKIENTKYRKIIDELKDEKEKLLNEKNSIINEFTLKFIERQSVVEEKQPSHENIKNIKKIIEDLFTKFEAEAMQNYDTYIKIDEMNIFKQQMNDIKLQANEDILRLLRKLDDRSIDKTESVSGDIVLLLEKLIDELKEENRYLKDTVKNMKEEADILKKGEENESSYLYEVIDIHKNQIEDYTVKIEDLSNSVSECKMSISMLEDDNNKLVELLDAALSYKSSKPKELKQAYGRIIDPNNRAAVKKVLNDKGISV